MPYIQILGMEMLKLIICYIFYLENLLIGLARCNMWLSYEIIQSLSKQKMDRSLFPKPWINGLMRAR